MNSSARNLYRRKAQVLGAAAHPIRLAILECLRDGEVCVCDIAVRVQAGRPNVSRHLSVLLQAGLVDYRKDGLKMIYSLRPCCVPGLLDCLTRVVRCQAQQVSALLRAMEK